MAARLLRTLAAGLFLSVLVGCAVSPIESPARIALLAPFEGRYREIGYEALYAVRLAISESGRDAVTLLAVDDGGSMESARSRAQALADDPLVKIVIVLGYDAASVTDSFDDVPIIVVENWFIPPGENTFILGSRELEKQVTTEPRIEVTEAARIDPPAAGGIVFALQGFQAMRDDYSNISLLSSAVPPDADFRQRYKNSDLFTPEPGLLATLSYDAANIALRVVADHSTSRSDVTEALKTRQFEGINGPISFQDGYWLEAPLYQYTYQDDGSLVLADDPVE